MTPSALAILLFAVGAILIVAEVLLPAHGVIGLIGLVSLLAGVGVCFWINQYLGLGALIALVAVTPFAAMLWVKVFPHTPVGRRLILGRSAGGGVSEGRAAPTPFVQVGQTGRAVTEMRPMGVCEFVLPAGPERVEARSEGGIIPAGQAVRVVGLVDRRPTVRPV